jgi:hypothetical protein
MPESNESLALSQFMSDLQSLMQNLVRSSQNREVECAILHRQLEVLLPKGEGQFDFNSLIKDNMAEILRLRLENTQLSQ